MKGSGAGHGQGRTFAYFVFDRMHVHSGEWVSARCRDAAGLLRKGRTRVYALHYVSWSRPSTCDISCGPSLIDDRYELSTYDGGLDDLLNVGVGADGAAEDRVARGDGRAISSKDCIRFRLEGGQSWVAKEADCGADDRCNFVRFVYWRIISA
jgi:hypothetical protein